MLSIIVINYYVIILTGIKDVTGEYDTLFYILGTMALFCAILWILDAVNEYICKCFKCR